MRKLQRNTKISLAALFLVPIIISTIGLSIYGVMDEKIYLNSLYAQGEIVILNDYDFSEKYSFPGSGTAEDPFLIENYLFDDPDTTAIVIKDTTKHFIIRNCSISKLGQPLFISNIGFNTGVLINNTFIEDTTLETSAKFFDVRESRDRMILDSYLQPYEDGFTFILNAPGLRIENNLFHSNINLTSNFCNGLCIISSDYSVISNNTISFFKWGVNVYDSQYVSIANNFFFSNSIGIRIDEIHEAVIMNNVCTKNTIGIDAHYSTIVKVIANNLSYNIAVGLNMNGLINFWQVRGNLLEGNNFGLFGWIFNSNITYNYFSLNSNYGLVLELHISLSNYIHHNAFIDNNYEGVMLDEKQAFDDNTDINHINFWYDDYSKEGNYWSDLIWNEDSEYLIDGGIAIDQYPLFEQPIIEPWEDLN